VAVTPDGSKVYVTNNGDSSVSVIGAATNTVVATITVGGGPLGVAVSPDGSKVYVTSHFKPATESVIDTVTNTVVSSTPLSSFNEGAVVSPDGSKLYVAFFYGNSIGVIDTATNTLIGFLPAGTKAIQNNNCYDFGDFRGLIV
jgi:YVTN family beta-propeller protein